MQIHRLFTYLCLIVFALTVVMMLSDTVSPTFAHLPATAVSGDLNTYMALIQRNDVSLTPTVTPTPPAVPECAGFYDDFSDPASGWPVRDSSLTSLRYFEGEYRVAAVAPGRFVVQSPAPGYAAYGVEADMRWVGTPLGTEYGLEYGHDEDDQYAYQFAVNATTQQFRLERRNGQQPHDIIIADTASGAILPGHGVNHLKVTVDGNNHRLEINGTVVATVSEPHDGLRKVGLLIAVPLQSGIPDARFDNFCVSLPG